MAEKAPTKKRGRKPYKALAKLELSEPKPVEQPFQQIEDKDCRNKEDHLFQTPERSIFIGE